MTAIQKFLSDCRQVESKCTAGPWAWCYDGSSDWSVGKAEDPQAYPVANVYNYHKPSSPDAEFIAFSRNNFLKLVECVSVLSEACEYYIGRSGSRVAQQTLEKVESILKSE